MLQDISVSVLQAQTLSHIAGYKSVSVFQAVKTSNSVSVLHTLTFVSVLQALALSVCCTH